MPTPEPRTDTHFSPDSLPALASRLRQTFLHHPFGMVRFWSLAVIRPNDQSYELVSVHHEGDRLDLVLVHSSREGLASVLSIWEPQGLEAAPPQLGQGVTFRSALRLRWHEVEAVAEGERFRARTPRGEGLLERGDAPALVLAH